MLCSVCTCVVRRAHIAEYKHNTISPTTEDDDKLHRSCEMGARNVDMNPVVDALLGVRLMIAGEVDDSDDGLPQVWGGGGSRHRAGVQASRAML